MLKFIELIGPQSNKSQLFPPPPSRNRIFVIYCPVAGQIAKKIMSVKWPKNTASQIAKKTAS